MEIHLNSVDSLFTKRGRAFLATFGCLMMCLLIMAAFSASDKRSATLLVIPLGLMGGYVLDYYMKRESEHQLVFDAMQAQIPMLALDLRGLEANDRRFPDRVKHLLSCAVLSMEPADLILVLERACVFHPVHEYIQTLNRSNVSPASLARMMEEILDHP